MKREEKYSRIRSLVAESRRQAASLVEETPLYRDLILNEIHRRESNGAEDSNHRPDEEAIANATEAYLTLVRDIGESLREIDEILHRPSEDGENQPGLQRLLLELSGAQIDLRQVQHELNFMLGFLNNLSVPEDTRAPAIAALQLRKSVTGFDRIMETLRSTRHSLQHGQSIV